MDVIDMMAKNRKYPLPLYVVMREGLYDQQYIIREFISTISRYHHNRCHCYHYTTDNNRAPCTLPCMCHTLTRSHCLLMF